MFFFDRFPANHVQEIRTEMDVTDGAGASSLSESGGGDASAQPLGALQKGSYDIVGVKVEYVPRAGSQMEHILRMAHPITLQEFEVAAETKEDALTVQDLFGRFMLCCNVYESHFAVGVCDHGNCPVRL